MASRAIHTPVGAAAVQVYAPAAVNIGLPHVVVYNTGPAAVYVGRAGVTPANGLLLPSRGEIAFANGLDAIYAVAGGLTLSGTATTNLTAPASGGTTSNLTVGTTANFAVGNIVQVGTGNNAETGTVSAIPDSTHLTLSKVVTYDHTTGQAVTTVTGAAAGTVKTVSGAT